MHSTPKKVVTIQLRNETAMEEKIIEDTMSNNPKCSKFIKLLILHNNPMGKQESILLLKKLRQ